jgi:hypothetical protein
MSERWKSCVDIAFELQLIPQLVEVDGWMMINNCRNEGKISRSEDTRTADCAGVYAGIQDDAKLTMPGKNFVHQGFLDVKEMANVLDRIALATEDWNVSPGFVRGSLLHDESGVTGCGT